MYYTIKGGSQGIKKGREERSRGGKTLKNQVPVHD